MTKEQYIKITEPLRSNPERAKRVTSLNHVLTALVFCVYPLYLFMLFTDKIHGSGERYLFRQCPLWDFPLSGKSSMRQDRMKNLTCRQYWKKTTKGKSFPSRHVFFCFHYRNDDFFTSIREQG